MVVTTLLLFVGIEISIPGGYRTVVLPNGFNPQSARHNAIVEEFHLDDPVIVRYLHWVSDAVRGDFGKSNRGAEGVFEAIIHRLPISLEIALASITLAATAGILIGVLAASSRNPRRSRVLAVVMASAQAVPVYLSATILISVFAVTLQWSRASGWVRLTDSVSGNLGALVLPTVALAFAEIGYIARTVKADVTAVLHEDYVTSAMSKGMSSRYVLFRHALRPASLGALNAIGVNVGAMLSGAVLIEIVFGLGGLGQLLFEASFARDLYLLLGLTVYSVGVFIVINTIVDLVVFWADPRIRRSSR